MPGAEYGFNRITSEMISGFVVSLIAKVLLGSFAILFNILSIVAIIALFDVIPFWSISYLLGWLFGLILIGPYFMSWWELPLYFVIGLSFLWIKIQNKF